MSEQSLTIFTIGHSNHPIETFIDLLHRNDVQVIVDVRSTPRSRYNPQFDQNMIEKSLRMAGIRYLFLGKELGARSDDPANYQNGRVVYGRLAQTALFKQGIERVKHGAATYRIALMCAEKEPLECHRTLLVAKALVDEGVQVEHILADGTREPHAETMERLLVMFDADQPELFRTREEQIADVLILQEKRIAYVDKRDGEESSEQPTLFSTEMEAE
jgi:uncharacterized protein (DUF488 family)